MTFTKFAIEAFIGMILFIIKILAAVLLFSVVLYTSYPALHNTQTIALLAGMQLVIWAIYVMAWFNWHFKPNPETAGV